MKPVNLAIIGLFMSSIIMCSCNNQAEETQTDATNNPSVTSSALSSASVAATVTGSDSSRLASGADTSAVKITSVAKSVPAKAALNPKHGEPGHRCDIPVGAPLDSKPVATPSISQPATPVTQTAATGALNPKHGEPGHRCDIPVGAPLNSAPANPAPAVTAAPPQNAPVRPAPISLSNSTSNMPKLPLRLPGVNAPSSAAPDNLKFNPKHGEPGHRCDLAVGAPLN